RYRNKSQIPFDTENGQVVAGFYKPRTHQIVDTDACLIQSTEADELMTMLKRNIQALGIDTYNERTHQGTLRHLIVRKGKKTGQVMVVLVTKQKKFPQKEAIVELIKQVIPDVTSIVQNINSAKTNVIMGDET